MRWMTTQEARAWTTCAAATSYAVRQTVSPMYHIAMQGIQVGLTKDMTWDDTILVFPSYYPEAHIDG